MSDTSGRADLRQVIPISEGYRRREERREASRMRDDEPPMSKRQVAERYGVSVRTVSRWMQRGLPYSKPYEGGAVRLWATEVDAWMQP